MQNKRKISITKHALDRLEERVRPKTRGAHSEFLSNPANAKRALDSVVNRNRRALIPVEDKLDPKGGIFYDTVFESYDGIIPLRCLIRESHLVTLWTTGGWRKMVVHT